ncbi:uncharacterized protein LOC121391440 [Gigantopelta aegis]|uniref:uncharacterized protein LOC121391440 n=1 Tax=Gigantopelta aegis TaxID=1735272 RepID=UPI001B88866C|nr:uncharacterized protein LOC121391440 [Gigantopelta aegis]
MSHRSYQPTLPCGNKLLQKRWDEAYYQEHKRRMELERTQIIDRDNMTLLHKMQHIMSTKGSVDHWNTYQHHRLRQDLLLLVHYRYRV